MGRTAGSMPSGRFRSGDAGASRDLSWSMCSPTRSAGARGPRPCNPRRWGSLSTSRSVSYPQGGMRSGFRSDRRCPAVTPCGAARRGQRISRTDLPAKARDLVALRRIDAGHHQDDPTPATRSASFPFTAGCSAARGRNILCMRHQTGPARRRRCRWAEPECVRGQPATMPSPPTAPGTVTAPTRASDPSPPMPNASTMPLAPVCTYR